MQPQLKIFCVALGFGVLAGSLFSPTSAQPANVIPWIRTHQLQIKGIQMAITEEGAAMWITNAAKKGWVQAGVHSNGFPFLLVSDGLVRTFGLGRVDGRLASPIMVFRSNDIVKMVLGLSMTEAGQNPFLVHYAGDGKKNDFIGTYCNDPGRVCTN